jgi:hypothetical protein
MKGLIKYSFLFFIACCLLPIVDLFSQAPSGFNYQAVARNSDGAILQNRNIKFG